MSTSKNYYKVLEVSSAVIPVNHGVIVPRDSLPDDWQEGTEVAVEKSPQAKRKVTSSSFRRTCPCKAVMFRDTCCLRPIPLVQGRREMSPKRIARNLRIQKAANAVGRP